MEFHILGPLEVVDGDRPVALPRGRGRALLALLILRAGEVVSTDRLIDELWGEAPPPTARTALQGLVSGLRRRLWSAQGDGETRDLIQTHPIGYALAIDREQVDAFRFRRLLEEGKGLPISERAAQLRSALALWCGPALADFTYEPFAQTDIAVLEELRLAAIEERIETDLGLGRHAELIGELKDLTCEQPLRERLREQLMLALYRSGRQAEALDVYRATRRTLIDELGIEPGPALQALEQAILRQDSTLDVQPAPVSSHSSRRSLPAGPPTATQPWLPGGRKTVTVVFLNLAQSGSAADRLDAEALGRITRHQFKAVAGVITRYGGTIEQLIGDTMVAVFGIPVAHEDDAQRALRAAIELRGELTAGDEEVLPAGAHRLVARMGIDTGEVLIGDPTVGQAMVAGEAVNMAARLQQAAVENEILVGQGTRRLTRHAARLEPVEHAAPGIDGRAITAWRLLDVVAGAPPVTRRFDAPLIGRAAELAQLRAVFDRTVQERRTCRFTAIGEAGIGKTRLARAFADSLGRDALVLVGHCPAYSDGMTFWPLREIVSNVARKGRKDLLDLLAGEDDADSLADQIMAAVGLTLATGKPSTPLPALRRFFEALARGQPVVVMLEDVHWAQPTLLDLVDYLVEWTEQPVLLLCLARPELLEERGEWAESKPNAASLILEPLGPEDIEKLIADRLVGRRLPPEMVDRVTETSQGNPLFAEQLLAAAIETEGQVVIPASVQALLAARLDRLGPAERDLLRTAAVLGTDFSVEALISLLPEEARPFAGRHLQTLEGKQLVRPSRANALGGETFSFRHVLIQMAAYRSMTREIRSRLHEAYAEWLEAKAKGRLGEVEEIAGYHLEHAYEERRRLGLLDGHSRGLAERAGERLVSAGLRAYSRFDIAAAENLWSRAKALLPSDHGALPQVRRHLAEAFQILGRHDAADTVLAEMREDARAGQNRALEQVIDLERARICLFTGPDPVRLQTIREAAEQSIEVLGEVGDEAGLALACYTLGHIHMLLGEVREMETTARRGLEHAIRSGEPREEAAARILVALALALGETPVPECLRECEQLAPWLGMEHPLVLCEMANLQAMRGDFDGARALIARGRRLLVERVRARRPLMFATRSCAAVEILAGDLAAGERDLWAVLQMAQEMREREWVSQFAAVLSRVLSIQGSAEAERFSALSFETAPAENVAAQALWRTARALVLTGHGDHQEAERLAREATHLVPPAMLNLGADVRVDLAEVLLAAGGRKAALPVLGEAIALYERKGNLVSAARARY